jgi:hypothetical protein
MGREESFAPTHSSRSSSRAASLVWRCFPENRILASGKARFSASANRHPAQLQILRERCARVRSGDAIAWWAGLASFTPFQTNRPAWSRPSVPAARCPFHRP